MLARGLGTAALPRNAVRDPTLNLALVAARDLRFIGGSVAPESIVAAVVELGGDGPRMRLALDEAIAAAQPGDEVGELLRVLSRTESPEDDAAAASADRPSTTPPRAARDDDGGDDEGAPLTKSYASAVRVLRDPELRAIVLGDGELEWNEQALMPTIGRRKMEPEAISALREKCELYLRTSKGKRLEFSRENLEAAVLQVAHERPFHPVRDYLNELAWDGVERADFVADEILGLERTPYATAVLRKFLIGAVARALRPGCKVDTSTILVGPQGVGKSRFWQTLAGEGHFCDTPVTIGNRDSLLVLHSSWVHEWAELETMLRARDAAAVKSFLSSGEDIFRAPYDRAARHYLRSCVIVGSTNQEQFLADETGNRRFWTLRVTRRIDVERLATWRDQLWAEAVHRFRAGESWWLDDDQERLLRRVQERHQFRDPWAEVVVPWATGEAANGRLVVASRALEEALRLPASQWTRAAEMRIASLLRASGFRSSKQLVRGRQTRCWVPRSGRPQAAKDNQGRPRIVEVA